MTDAYEARIEQARRNIQCHNFPPKYEPDKWNGQPSQCYGYALDLFDVPLSEFGVVLPGFLTHKIIPGEQRSLPEIINDLADDVKQLGRKAIPFQDPFAPLKPDAYKVAIYISEQLNDLHFRRQDADGEWSEKCGWLGPLRRVSKEELEWYFDDEEQLGYILLGFIEIVKDV